MIRPLTIATCLMACGSGLYLYQSKHEVQLLDRTIERTVHDTEALREQSRLLAAEWTMLNDPERLRQFSDTYLTLKTITPSQFTSLADLDNRLPAPLPEVPARGTDEQPLGPVAAEAVPPGAPDPTPVADAVAPAPAAVADADLPVPPIPAAARAPAVASAAHPAETRIPDRVLVSRPMSADGQVRSAAIADARASEQRPPEQRFLDQRPVEQRANGQRANEQRVNDQRGYDQRGYDQHLAEQRAVPRMADARGDVRTQAAPPPRPIVLAAPRPPLPANGPVSGPPAIAPARPPMVAATSAPYAGSLLGMARGSMPPAPRPTPVNATYNSN